MNTLVEAGVFLLVYLLVSPIYLSFTGGNTIMLTDTEVRKARQGAKPYKLSDEKGLYLI
jgi:hypothetical protein